MPGRTAGEKGADATTVGRFCVRRDYVNATMGFEGLSGLTATPAKSLMRMLSPTGNPRARNLLSVIAKLQRAEGLRLQLK